MYDNISVEDICTVGLGGASRSRGSQTAIVRGCPVASLAAATRPGQDHVNRQGDRILIPSIDVDERFESDRLTGSWVVDPDSTLLLLLEI